MITFSRQFAHVANDNDNDLDMLAALNTQSLDSHEAFSSSLFLAEHTAKVLLIASGWVICLNSN